MIKVITYGTYDVLHYGHIRLLERAKALGDYLVVGITSDDYDKSRGKINNQQSLVERIQNVKNTGLADEIVIEEYEGQKIDDIKRLGIDIFTVGSDWEGKFDYLNEFCKVIYLPRTVGISSTEVRAQNRKVRLGIVGKTGYRDKIINETQFVNGIEITGLFSMREDDTPTDNKTFFHTSSYEELLERVDAVYILSNPEYHYIDTKEALEAGKHVLCESPIAFCEKECEELHALAEAKDLILMDVIKTAYSTAFERLVLLGKSGKIGDILSIDATCTSQKRMNPDEELRGSLATWGPFALLPIFQLLGTDYTDKSIVSKQDANGCDIFTRISFVYPHSVASIKVATGAKSEGELIISGKMGYIYVPAPWWKTDYFEIRYEEQEKNKRFFYQLDGEGIRNEIVVFVKSIESKKNLGSISKDISRGIARIVEDYINKNGLVEI